MLRSVKFIGIFLLLFSYLYAKQSDIQNIVQMTKQQVFELDIKGIKSTLVPYLKEKPSIERIVIKDTLTNEIIFAIRQHDSKQIIDKKLSFHCPRNLQETLSNIDYQGDTIGQISMCTVQKYNTSILNLTKKEKAWIKAHPTIKVHNERNWAPMNFNKNGIPTGFSIDLMNLLAQKAGLKVKYITGEWNDLYIKAKNKKIDVMLNIAKNKERTKYFLFTSSYQKNANAIYGRKSDHSISDIQSLVGKKVAMVDGFYYEEILRKKYPLIQIVPKKNTKETLQSVCIGEADATIGSFIVNNHLLNNMVCNNIEFKSELPSNDDQNLHIAVRNDYPELLSILNKALADVGSNELNKMRRKWISLNSKKRMLSLTYKEHKWIEEHRVINVGGELDWAPFDFVDETNTYSGLTKDYLDLISSLTGITFKIHTGQSWNELVKSLEKGELDLLPAIYYNEKRTSFLDFTNPYLTITDFYITKKDHKKIDNIKELFGKKVAVIKGYQLVNWLQKTIQK